MPIRYALLSVSDKTNIEVVAHALLKSGLTLLSTGGTLKALKKANLPVYPIESVTQFPEMMDGRVKTLHPKVHGGLLALRENTEHLAAMRQHDITPIDVVVVNLYPFKEVINQPDVSLHDAIENIDIGGPSMLRSAAKNYRAVTVVTDPRDYDQLIQQLDENGKTSLEFRQYLARKVFQLTAHYDAVIGDYLMKQFAQEEGSLPQDSLSEWSHLTLTYEHKQALRYGENTHQTADFYRSLDAPAYSIANAKQLHGKEMSYNNIKDANAALQIVREFTEPCAVAVKHLNPCGVAIGETIEDAYALCYAADPMSIFGGIVAVNRPVTLALAEKLHEIFLEIIIAPAFDEAALELLAKKKNIRLLTLEIEPSDQAESLKEYTAVVGGLLVQDSDHSTELEVTDPSHLPSQWEAMTERIPSADEIKAMSFAMKVCKHVKSNAIVISNGQQTLGIGGGQMNRVGAAKIALEQAKPAVEGQEDAVMVMASDAFFPMEDTVLLAAEYGVSAVIQPGGSLKDQLSVQACNDHQMTMVKTGIRHFKH